MASSETETIGIEKARAEIAGGSALAVDVRSGEEWSDKHIPGAIHLPDGDPEQIGRGNLAEEGARLVVIASDGKRAARAATDLSKRGYDAVAVDGSMDDWVSENFNVQPTGDPSEDTELGAG
jgi:rhodanese-related sulfurtransferase